MATRYLSQAQMDRMDKMGKEPRFRDATVCGWDDDESGPIIRVDGRLFTLGLYNPTRLRKYQGV